MANIKTIRERLGLTQAELADRLGVTQSTMSRLETGDIKRPSIHLAHSLEIATGGAIPMSVWAGGKSKPATKPSARKGAQKADAKRAMPSDKGVAV